MTDKVNKANTYNYEYDLVVIGGGSGGLVAAQEAAKLGAKVVIFDYVTPSPHGTSWGLGGTCVNVGCIPKKLMHNAGLLGEAWSDYNSYGFKTSSSKPEHNWETLVENVNTHISSLNWGYRSSLRQNGVTYLNAYASFMDKNTIKYKDSSSGEDKFITTISTIIAIGGRPRYPSIPGVELAITSDDIFSLNKSPGKTLVVGGSYVALECGGFLAGLGYETTIMIRSIPLRGFDKDMANHVVSYMETSDYCHFIRGSIPTKLEKTVDGRIMVTYRSTAIDSDSKYHTECYDTVLFAIGRKVDALSLGLEGLTLDSENGKISVTYDSQTSVPDVYVIGDAVQDSLELTPIAIREGKRLVRQLFKTSDVSDSPEPSLLAHDFASSVVFTPLEYGFVGLSSADAEKEYGANGYETYHSYFTPLEWKVGEMDGGKENRCYCKVIVVRSTDQVVGLHLLAPHAGEIVSGYGLAINIGLTRSQLMESLAVHPTIAETLHKLEVSVSSGKDASEMGC